MKVWTKGEVVYAKYDVRSSLREKKLMKATIDFVGYFMSLGGDKLTADTKVSQVSTEISQYLYVYTLGNSAPLISSINNIDELVYPFMDAAAKAALVGFLRNT